MKHRRILLLTIVCFMLCTLCTAQASAPKRVVANVTTQDVNRAAMAIKFTHAIMKQRGIEGVLFFNVYGVTLVNANKPSPVYPSGESIAEMLTAFMNDGGKVIACPMCMKNVGAMTQQDLLKGVQAQKGMGAAIISEPDTLVLSY